MSFSVIHGFISFITAWLVSGTGSYTRTVGVPCAANESSLVALKTRSLADRLAELMTPSPPAVPGHPVIERGFSDLRQQPQSNKPHLPHCRAEIHLRRILGSMICAWCPTIR